MTESDNASRRIRVSNIQWDTEGSKSAAKKLPRELIVEVEADDDDDTESLTARAIDQCCETTGWAIADCTVTILE